MLDNCTYNKVKLLHDLSSIAWFIDKCCEQDMKNASESVSCSKDIEALRKDLEKHIEHLQKHLNITLA